MSARLLNPARPSPLRTFLLALPWALGTAGLAACGDAPSGDDSELGTAGDAASVSASGSGASQSGEAGEGESGEDSSGDDCVEILGNCSNDPGGLIIEAVLSAGDGLNGPTDLEFNPEVPGELWVTNRNDFSMVIANAITSGSPNSMRVQENFGGGVHFLAKPAAIAFGQPGTFATAQQEDGFTQPQTPFDFMGPTLWGSSLSTFDGGHAGHLDMLHNSPLSSGLAWAGGNVYWVYDGAHGSLSRYDFVQDHGLGGTDHSDGVMYRTMDGMLGYEPGVASHVGYDFDTGMVYAADTAKGQIVALDSNSGQLGGTIGPDYDGGTQRMVDNTTSSILVDGNGLDPVMSKPSGLELHDGLVFVTDFASSRIYAFDMGGSLVDWLETGLAPNSIMGMAFDSDGSLVLADHANNQVIRISVP